ncbi:cholesterol 7-alpha-monooxygenase 2 [Podospora aff. communis PSN243]|uniref:Cholesterol 7-alpha-monooxygenase 2 n=1 Tax=Podospora aff. communis PSN243 TaxID=3040156 RepID=A0AAV9GJS5_9PEZI|nr:cholesterol 7-alpha-monooxygenase 2 [Podospora aff. communis PSN243]
MSVGSHRQRRRHTLIFLQGTILALISFAALFALTSRRQKGDGVPTLPEKIPYLSSALLYMTDMHSFLSKVATSFRSTNIIAFHLGPQKIYMIAGARNVSKIFRATANVGQEIFILKMQKYLYGSAPADYAKFLHDKSGRAAKPAPGTEGTPESKRYWYGMNNLLHGYLARAHDTNVLAGVYQREFNKVLEEFSTTGWSEVLVYGFLQKYMVEAATTTLLGPRILEVNPDFLRVFWDFDGIATSLVWGLPRWMNRAAWKARDRLHAAAARYLYPAVDEFDWKSADATADWEPVFGSRANREVIRWMKEDGFDPQTIAGAVTVLFIFGVNGNTTPAVAWLLMEIVKDPDLFRRVREEVKTTYTTDPDTGERLIDAQKLIALPLLQSIYIEGLRLHVSLNVTREVIGPLSLEGYELEKGAILQAPTDISHREESVWGAPGHPASEFWAERHIKYVETVDEKDGSVKLEPQFSMAGRQNDFFPYGGGAPICPGRFFAKQEMMLTVAILVSRFDIEFVEWTHPDGSPSDRPAQNDGRWAGAASVPPDRDMKIRWKRLW